MTKADRRMHRFMEILQESGHISIREISRLLEVSEMTVRRDLRQMEDKRLVKNINGTIIYNGNQGGSAEEPYNLLDEVDRHSGAKEQIGRFAATLVEDGDIIVIDTGTTTEKLVPHLPAGKSLTALCYNANILFDLLHNPGVTPMFAGGLYYPNTQMFSSEQGVQFVHSIRTQKAFISAAGIHEQLGITCANAYEVSTKQAVMQSSMWKILLADSSKFGNVRSAYFCDLDEINEIVTDAALSEEWQARFESMGIRLHLV